MLSFLNLSYKYTKISIADMIGVDHMEKFVCTRATKISPPFIE